MESQGHLEHGKIMYNYQIAPHPLALERRQLQLQGDGEALRVGRFVRKID